MTKAIVYTQIRFRELRDRCESGQGTLEYVGMVIVAAMLVAFVVAAVKGAGVEAKITSKVKEIVDSGK